MRNGRFTAYRLAIRRGSFVCAVVLVCAASACSARTTGSPTGSAKGSGVPEILPATAGSGPEVAKASSEKAVTSEKMRARYDPVLRSETSKLTWPADYQLDVGRYWAGARALWDTDFSESSARFAIRFMNACAWTIELSDRVAAHDGTFQTGLSHLRDLPSRLSDLGFMRDAFEAVAADAELGSTTAAENFISANGCRPFPKS